MKRILALISSIVLASCGGGGESKDGPFKGKFVVGTASENGTTVERVVEGVKACLKGEECTESNGEGEFTLSSIGPIEFYAGSVKLGEYYPKNPQEEVTPFKLAPDPKAGALIAKVLHAVAGDLEAKERVLNLEGLQVEWSEEGSSVAEKALGNETFTIEVNRGERLVRAYPQEAEVEACSQSGCKEVSYLEWLVLVYMDGDNTLSSFVKRDLEEIERAQISPLVKVVALADYAGSQGGSWIEATFNYYAEEAVPEPNMGDEETLKNFILKATEENPAQKVSLVLWNHGDGWRGRGAALDNSSNDELYMYEVTEAIKAAREEGRHLDLIGFDECLMGMAEVFYDAGVLSQAVVASETYEPGEGWDYEKLLNELSQNPAATPYELGTMVVDAYRESYEGLSQATMALLSREEVKRLTDGINELAQRLTPENSHLFREARERAVEVEGTNFVDLLSLVEELPFEEALKVREVIEGIYSFSSDGRFGGVSIYFPEEGSDPDLECYLLEEPGEGGCFNDENYYNPFAVNLWDDFLEEYFLLEER